MSFYSSGDVETRYLDPKSFIDGNRAVFELHGHHLATLPNMRLFDNGIFGQNNGIYNLLVGADSIITNIVLYDGRTILTQLSSFGLFRGFVNQNQGNVKTMSIRNAQSCNQIGYEKDNTDGLLDNLGTPTLTGTTRANSKGSYIDLREVLPMLNSMTHLPSDLFPNLRLEVTYDIASARQIMTDISQTTTGMLVPQLAIDVLDDAVVVSKMNKTMKNIQWLEIEKDQTQFPVSANNGAAADNNIEQELNVNLNGFKGKSVERMLIIKEIANVAEYLTGNAVNGFGRYSSVAFFKEKLQVRVNGQNLFPKQGIVGDMERMAYLVDSFGECFSFPGANQLDLDSGLLVGLNAADGRKKIGQLSYSGFYLGKRVIDLQMSHARTGIQDNGTFKPATSAVNMHYFGEIRKGLVMGKNGYNVVYV